MREVYAQPYPPATRKNGIFVIVRTRESAGVSVGASLPYSLFGQARRVGALEPVFVSIFP